MLFTLFVYFRTEEIFISITKLIMMSFDSEEI